MERKLRQNPKPHSGAFYLPLALAGAFSTWVISIADYI